MTKNEAYEYMQQGYPVSHKNFGPDQYLYMDQDYIIRDENGIAFEASWDVQNNDRQWDLDWFIFKNAATKRVGAGRKPVQISTNSNLISHIQGKECPGKENCLQYVNIAGETACLVCDVNEDQYRISESENLETKYIEMIPETNSSDIVDEYKKLSLRKRIINKIISFLSRFGG